MRRHTPFYIAAALGILALVAALVLVPKLGVAIGADVFFATYLALNLYRLPSLTAKYLSEHAQSADEPALVILLVTFGAVAVAMISVFLLLSAHGKPETTRFILTLISVPLGWMTIHMMAAFHYAHLYWRPNDTTKKSGKPEKKQRGGLSFPGDDEPDIYDFLYFSYVIGMTAQTSDVEIEDWEIRRLNLVHSIISFFFNTVLVAAAVNVAVSLGQ